MLAAAIVGVLVGAGASAQGMTSASSARRASSAVEVGAALLRVAHEHGVGRAQAHQALVRDAGAPARDGVGVGDGHGVVEADELAHAGRQADGPGHAEIDVVEAVGGEALRWQPRQPHRAGDDAHDAEIGGVELLGEDALAVRGRQRLLEQDAPDRAGAVARPQLGELVVRAEQGRRLDQAAETSRVSAHLPIARHPVQDTRHDRGVVARLRLDPGQVVHPGRHEQAGEVHAVQPGQHVEDQPGVLGDAHVAVSGVRQVHEDARTAPGRRRNAQGGVGGRRPPHPPGVREGGRGGA